jgi:hypothetical protein
MMKKQLTLKETRELKTLFLESEGILTEGILDRIKDSVKKRFSGKDTEELKQNLSDNLGIDENSSVKEIEEKLRQKTGGDESFPILKKILYHVSGTAASLLIWEVQAMIGAGIVKYFDYNPIAIAAVVIFVFFSVTDKWEKIRRKGIGKKMDQYLFGKRSHLGDYDDKKEDYKEMNENRRVIKLTENDLTRIVKRVIRESKFDKITSVGIAGLTATGLIFYVNDLNDVDVVDRDGNEYEAETGDIFKGKILDMEGAGPKGAETIITLRTKDGKEVTFRTSKRVYDLKPGDTITVKVSEDSWLFKDRGHIER